MFIEERVSVRETDGKKERCGQALKPFFFHKTSPDFFYFLFMPHTAHTPALFPPVVLIIYNFEMERLRIAV